MASERAIDGAVISRPPSPPPYRSENGDCKEGGCSLALGGGRQQAGGQVNVA